MPPKPPKHKGPGPPHPPPHGPPKPPHEKGREKKPVLIISIFIATAVTVFFYIGVSLAGVKPEGAVPGSVALWVGLVTILFKLLERH